MPLKQLILVRKDLNMSPGKLAAQVAHASVNVINANYIHSSLSGVFHDWMDSGHTKVVLAVKNYDDILYAYRMADSIDVPTYTVEDEGRTEFDNVPTVTCMAIGPWDSDKLDSLFRSLPLY